MLRDPSRAAGPQQPADAGAGAGDGAGPSAGGGAAAEAAAAGGPAGPGSADGASCPICLDALERRTVTSCGHTFCTGDRGRGGGGRGVARDGAGPRVTAQAPRSPCAWPGIPPIFPASPAGGRAHSQMQPFGLFAKPDPPHGMTPPHPTPPHPTPDCIHECVGSSGGACPMCRTRLTAKVGRARAPGLVVRGPHASGLESSGVLLHRDRRGPMHARLAGRIWSAAVPSSCPLRPAGAAASFVP
jgi:hypothetical protein